MNPVALKPILNMPVVKPIPLPSPDRVAINAALIAVRQASQVLCDRASLLVLLHAHCGACRYAEFEAQTGLASRLLSSRLAQLTEDGLLVRIPYSRRPLRHAYHLTHMGVALFEVLALWVSWEAAWPGEVASQTRIRITHLNCSSPGQALPTPTTVRMHCVHCLALVTPREISLRVNEREMAKMPTQSTATRRTNQQSVDKLADHAAVLPQGLAVLGDKWSIEVLVCAHFGARQFGEFGSRIGIATNILADRLARLVSAGLLRRNTEDEALRKGLYLLTPKGRDFYAVLVAIQSWADQWIDHRIRSPVKLRHIPCKKLLSTFLQCGDCGQVLIQSEARLEFVKT